MANGRRRLALALAGAALAATAAAALRPATVLEIENAARGRTFRVAVRPGEVFSVTSRHSIYDAPVTEEFAVGEGGAISLTAVSSPSAAVREYFGLAAAGERHAVARTLPEIVFRVAAGTPQTLRAGGVERSFLAFGDHGDRLVLRAARTPALAAALAGERAGGRKETR
ncbi:MAG TPA: hypothetical protein VLS93_10320 [Anaeromyxobacteraceae bacterium]|nr:hypothetical protein [Anaeromyxobacteraceae bacterium]